MGYWIERYVPDTGAHVRETREPFDDYTRAARFLVDICEIEKGKFYRIATDSSKGSWISRYNPEINYNELITYAQCGTTRLQQLVDLFGEMVQDKTGDPATRTRRIDALAEIIKNQLQELQTIATPTK